MENKTNSLFIKYDEAKSLKELGFDEPCLARYELIDRYKITSSNVYGVNYDAFCKEAKYKFVLNSMCVNSLILNECYAPTYQQAFRWFRQKYKFFSIIDLMGLSSYFVKIQLDTEEWRDKITIGGCYCEIVDLYSYEEAELACLRELIEIVKKQNNG